MYNNENFREISDHKIAASLGENCECTEREVFGFEISVPKSISSRKNISKTCSMKLNNIGTQQTAKILGLHIYLLHEILCIKIV